MRYPNYPPIIQHALRRRLCVRSLPIYMSRDTTNSWPLHSSNYSPGSSKMRCLTAMFFFLVLFVSSAQCRPTRSSDDDGPNSLVSNNTSSSNGAAAAGADGRDDDGKFTLIPCFKRDCQEPKWRECYCCMDRETEWACHDTWDECQASCPVCNPDCPPAPPSSSSIRPATGGRPLNDSTAL
ncbi:hypothetical protein ACP70R_042151 [Stipagrostis hirtigluma subsp. patula]